jgi:hypothetical protein
MTIYTKYAELRHNFSGLSTTADDGFKTWDDSLYGAGSFSGLDLPTNPNTLSFPFQITVNNEDADAVLGVDEYDWYLSEPGKADGRTPRLSITQSVPSPPTASTSGTVSIDRLDGDVLELDRLFFGCLIYVRRKSDGAFLVGDLYESLFSEVPV